MDRELPVDVASVQPDIISCQVDITHPDLRRLAVVGQVSDSPAGAYPGSEKISSENLSDVELRQAPPSGDLASIDVGGPHEIVTICRLTIRDWKAPQGVSETLLDVEDAERLRDHRWYVLTTKQGKKYVGANGGCGVVYMHREVLGVTGRTQVDHRDGNTLDNRRSNLRIATPSQQRANSKKKRGSASQFKGVYVREPIWIARIKHRHLGTFRTEEAAARAYDEAARAEFGEFALLNFPEEA